MRWNDVKLEHLTVLYQFINLNPSQTLQHYNLSLLKIFFLYSQINLDNHYVQNNLFPRSCLRNRYSSQVISVSIHQQQQLLMHNQYQSQYSPGGSIREQTDLSNVRVRKSFIDNKPMLQGVVRSILKVQDSGQAHLINSGLTDVEGARQIARNLFSFYDKDRSGSINTVKALPMLTNAYRVFNQALNPAKEDINSFFSTLDVDRDNQVRLQDLQALCIRYLTGSDQTVQYKFHSPSKHQPVNTSSSFQSRGYYQ